MGRLRNLLTTTLFLFFLVLPITIWMCEARGPELPSWQTSEDARWLSGGITRADIKSRMNIDDFKSEKLQNAATVEIDAHIPCKAKLMLCSAAFQRKCIELASKPFGWPCWPAYYGCSRLYIPEVDGLGFMPAKRNEAQLEQLRQLGANIRGYADNHPGTRICVALVQGYTDPSVSPAQKLMSNVLLPSEQSEALAEGAGTIVIENPSGGDYYLAEDGGVVVTTRSYPDMATYVEDYYRSDHHWNWHGAAHTYDDIAACMGLAPRETSSDVSLDNVVFSGSTARFALDLIDEPVQVSSESFSDLTVHYPDGTVKPLDRSVFYARSEDEKRYDFYEYYYNFIKHGAILDGPGEGEAAIVTNSFGSAVMPYIARNYKHMLKIGSVHPAFYDTSARLSNLLEGGNYTDIYIVANPGTLAEFAASCPDYFS